MAAIAAVPGAQVWGDPKIAIKIPWFCSFGVASSTTADLLLWQEVKNAL
jgi:hypothetical protein